MPPDDWTPDGADAGDDGEEGDEFVVRPFWSGTITFGLVSIPVNLYPANRSTRASLRMLDRDGTPLSRRYFCPNEEREVTSDEIVRGYEVDEGEFVIVEDDELEAVAPERTRDIDLQRFVNVNSIDPRFFRRSYFLTPARQSTKAYRLLAETMEKRGRAGVATFVMRGKEYVVAILSENGILQAETLRFADELRPLEEIELPEKPDVPGRLVERFERAVRGRVKKNLAMSELEDTFSEQVRRLVAKKKRRREDVVKAPEAAVETTAAVIDLMEVLKQRLQGRGLEVDSSGRARTRASGRKGGRARGSRRAGGDDDLESLSKQELYERARDLDIPGRSGMTKAELARAIREAAA